MNSDTVHHTDSSVDLKTTDNVVPAISFKSNYSDTRKQSGQIPDEVRQALVNSVINNGLTITEAAKLLNLNYSNAQAIIRVFKTTGRTNALKKGGRRNIKITEDINVSISTWLEENPALTLQQVQQLIYDKFQKHVSVKSISCSIKKLGYTFKLLRLIPESRNNAETIELRFQYALYNLKVLLNSSLQQL